MRRKGEEIVIEKIQIWGKQRKSKVKLVNKQNKTEAQESVNQLKENKSVSRF